MLAMFAAKHPADAEHGWWEWSGNSWLKQTPIKVVSQVYPTII
jgi:hypothetical protein